MSQKIKKIKEYLADGAVEHKIYENWKGTGLLDYSSGKDSKALALKLEEIAKTLLIDFVGYKEQLSVLAFVIVARAFHLHNYLIKDCCLVLNHINSKVYLIIDLSSCNDAEAEFCALMAEEISNLKL